MLLCEVEVNYHYSDNNFCSQCYIEHATLCIFVSSLLLITLLMPLIVSVRVASLFCYCFSLQILPKAALVLIWKHTYINFNVKIVVFLSLNWSPCKYLIYINVLLISENRGEFLEKLQRARSQVKPNAPSQPILSRPSTCRLIVGNWQLSARREGELHIHNSDGQQVCCLPLEKFIFILIHNNHLIFFVWLVQQATILREDLPGFIFESNRGTKHSFTAETSLGPEFAAGWTGKKGKRLRSKIEAIKQKVCALKPSIWAPAMTFSFKLN